MMDKLTYKGYYTEIHYSEEDQVLFGKIEGIADMVNFESDSAKTIERSSTTPWMNISPIAGRWGSPPISRIKAVLTCVSIPNFTNRRRYMLRRATKR